MVVEIMLSDSGAFVLEAKVTVRHLGVGVE